MEAPTKPKQPDAYADLEVSPAASSAEIKASFHRLALLYHPDKKAPGEIFDAADFRRIQEAYDILRDQERKKCYDESYKFLHAQWDAYRTEYVEYVEDPNGWRRKKAQAEAGRRAAEQQSQAQPQPQYEFYYGSDSDYEYGYQYTGQGFGPNYGGGFSGYSDYEYGRRSREPEWDPEEILLAELLRKYAYYEAAAKRSAERREKAAVEDINKRCIERLKKVAEAQQAKDDGIRIADPERRRTMAQSWVLSLRRDYDQELQKAGLRHSSDSVMDLGWERKKGRQTCLFCDAYVHEYSFRCPSGGAVACRGCKKEIESSSLNKPFKFHKTGSATNKGKGEKGGSGKKSTETKTGAQRDYNPEESDLAEQEHEGETEHPLDEEEAAKQVAEKVALKEAAQRQNQERRAEKARQKAESEAQAKLAREAAEKAAQEKLVKEKAEAKQAARDRAAAQEAARHAAEKKKEAREQEAREKKAARKKAAKKRAALEKATQKKAANPEAQEKDAPEREAQDTRENAEREAKQKSEKEAKAKTKLEAREREAEEHAAQEAQKRAAQDVQERTEREYKEREVETLATQEAKQRAELEAEMAEREARETVERVTRETVARDAREAAEQQTQNSTNADDAKAHMAKDEETRDGKQRVSESPSTTMPPAGPSIANSTAVPKKAKKKGTRPPLTCYVCNEQGHLARNCPVKRGKVTKVNVSPPRTATDPALNTKLANKPSPRTAAPANIVVKPLGPHEQTIEQTENDTTAASHESSTSSTNASASQRPVEPSKAPKKKAPRSAPRKGQGTNGVASSALPPTNPISVDGTTDVPVPTQASKPVKKSKVKGPLTCYTCNEVGHKAKSCPTKAKNQYLES